MVGVAIGAGCLTLVVVVWVATRAWTLAHAVPQERVVCRPGAFAALAAAETTASVRAATPEAPAPSAPDAQTPPRFDAKPLDAALVMASIPAAGFIGPVNKHLLDVFRQGVHAQLQTMSNLSVALEVTHVETLTTHLGTKLISDAYFVGAGMQKAAGLHSAHAATHVSLFCGHAHVVTCMGSPHPISEAFAGLHGLTVGNPFDTKLVSGVNVHLGALHPSASLATHTAAVVHQHASLGLHVVASAHSGLSGASLAGQAAAPVGALLISSFHEGRLLLAHDTDLARASKNVGVDVGGVLAGGKGGMLAGGSAGSVLGPHGAIIGGLVGGVVGVVGGKLAASKIKRHPLEVAKRQFVQARERFDAEEKVAVAEAVQDWESTLQDCQSALRERLRPLETEVDSLSERMADTLRETTALDRSTVDAQIAAAQSVLDERVALADERLQARLRLLGRLCPALGAPSEYRQLRQLREDVQAWREQVAALGREVAGDEARSERLLDLVLAVPGRDAPVRDHIRTINVARMSVLATMEAAHSHLVTECLTLRADAAAQLARHSKALKRGLTKRLTPFYEAIESAAEPFRDELRKVGQRAPESA